MYPKANTPEQQGTLVRSEVYTTCHAPFMEGVVHNQHQHPVGRVSARHSGRYAVSVPNAGRLGNYKSLGEHPSELAAHEAIRAHRLTRAGKLLPRSLNGRPGPMYN